MGPAGFINTMHPLLSGEFSNVYVQLRIPRVLLGFIVGSGLAVSGAVLQTLFRNDLCSESTLGVSSFASLGAILGVFLNLSGEGISILAFFGAAFSLVILFMFIQRGMIDESARLLLAGISLGLIASCLISLLQHIGGIEKIFAMSKWLEGGLEIVGFESLLLPFISMVFAVLVSLKFSKELDLMQVGFQYAKGRGVNTRGVGIFLILAVSVFVGVSTSITGPIGFVGLVVPHAVRYFTGAIHFRLIYCSSFVGGIFLVVVDLVSRTIVSPAELPVSIFTGLIGAPFFLMLLFSRVSVRS